MLSVGKGLVFLGCRMRAGERRVRYDLHAYAVIYVFKCYGDCCHYFLFFVFCCGLLNALGGDIADKHTSLFLKGVPLSTASAAG